MIHLLRADARQIPLASESVQCVVTSPPYWGLRDYGIGADQLGLEPTPELYVEHMIEVFREVRRGLRDDGTLWLNMGDSYQSGSRGGYDRNRAGASKNMGATASDFHAAPNRLPQAGLKDKDLIGMPWRLAFALQADGWYLRSEIIWAKPNPMPESVRDRPTRAHEQVFLLSKRARYFYDDVAVKELTVYGPRRCVEGAGNHVRADSVNDMRTRPRHAIEVGERRNIRSVWTIATEPFPDAHFATFPEDLVRPCIAAGTSEAGGCAECGAPWRRVIETTYEPHGASAKSGGDYAGGERRAGDFKFGKFRPQEMPHGRATRVDRSLGFRPSCSCATELPPVPQLVLDPFGGSGTVALVAAKMGRRAVSLDLKPEYLAMARERTRGVRAQMPLALDVRGNGAAEQLALIEEAP